MAESDPGKGVYEHTVQVTMASMVNAADIESVFITFKCRENVRIVHMLERMIADFEMRRFVLFKEPSGYYRLHAAKNFSGPAPCLADDIDPKRAELPLKGPGPNHKRRKKENKDERNDEAA